MGYHHSLLFAGFTGGFGIVFRFLVALLILVVLRNMNPKDEFISKGIKWLTVGAVILLSVFVFFAMLMFMLFGLGIFIPSIHSIF